MSLISSASLALRGTVQRLGEMAPLGPVRALFIPTDVQCHTYITLPSAVRTASSNNKYTPRVLGTPTCPTKIATKVHMPEIFIGTLLLKSIETMRGKAP